MSRILRRPMFRGGRVDSRGTGITSGLMDDTGYAGGGRVGFQIGGFSRIPGIDDLSQVGIYNPFSGIISQNITPLQRRQQNIESGKVSSIFAPSEQQLFERNRPRTPMQFDEAIQKGLDITRSKPFERSDESFPSRKIMEESKPEIGTAGNENLLSEDDLTEQQIKRESKLYEKLLGGEEARTQAGFDALLAAAPAFFKGKNLKEALPQVFETVNKSGAFDKPRDIRQAAAQLAIQRRIAVETARAKSDDQLTRLEKQLSAKDSVLNKIGRIPGIQKGDYLGDLARLPTTEELGQLQPDKFYSIGNDIYQTIGANIKDEKGKVVKRTIKISKLG